MAGPGPSESLLARTAIHARSYPFDADAQCFKAPGLEKTATLVAQMDRPLSLTFQLTRDCNFSCTYCSEPPGITTRSHEELLAMIDKLSGMRRIILSGDEPMRYKYFWEG